MIDKPAVLGIGTALPPFRYSQTEIFERFLEPHFGRNRRARAIFNHAGVAHRYTAVEGSYYDQERTTQERNNCYVSQALPLGETAIRRCLEQAGLSPQDITDFLVVSCTGLDIPGLDLRLAGQLGMPSNLRRTCVLGMGCYGAFPALVRAADAVTARPDAVALVLALELCSLHLQFDDTLENIVASALFADGAAAVVISQRGDDHAADHQSDQSPRYQSLLTTPANPTTRVHPREAKGPDGSPLLAGEALGERSGPHPSPRYPMLIDAATFCDYKTFDHMAFHVTDHGFKMNLSAYVPNVLAANVNGLVSRLLNRHGLEPADVRFWGVHPGSGKILDHVQESFSLDPSALDCSRAVLRDYGNMSSATILFVLDEIVRTGDPAPGDYGVLMGFGPGLTLETALVQW